MSEADDSLYGALRHLDDWLRIRRQWWEEQNYTRERELEERMKRHQDLLAGTLRRYVLAVVREEAE